MADRDPKRSKGSGKKRRGAESALAKAQELADRALETEEGDQRVRLAQQAIGICPDCADAYVVLAEQAPKLEEAIRWYEEGVRAGERAVGERQLAGYRGRVWDLRTARPYLRARLGLGQCLWEAGRREEAVEHFWELLRLNTADDQGVWSVLAACLLDLGRDEELRSLLETYRQPGTAAWNYARALLEFRNQGDTQEARRLLAKALQANRHVPAYLLGDRPLPDELPFVVRVGSRNEAASVAARFITGWRSTPGALTWLRKAARACPFPRSRGSAPATARVPSELPQVAGETWQVDSLRLQEPLRIGEEVLRPWVILVVSLLSERILALEMTERRPADQAVWTTLLLAMRRPAAGRPRRPEEIQVRTARRCAAWHGKLEELGIRCVSRGELEFLDWVLHETHGLLPLAPPRSDNSPAGAAQLAALPQCADERWQADIRRMPSWVEGKEGGVVRPWCLMVTDCTHELILRCELVEEHPDPDALWEQLAKAMCAPVAGDPRRPAQVQVRSQDHRNALMAYLRALDIECVASDELDQLDAAFEDMIHHLAGKRPMPALLDVPGVRPEQVGSYFEAAAAYYQRRPWNDVPGDTPIKIECRKFQHGTWYAFVMGQSGMTVGLALHDDLEAVRSMIQGQTSDRETARRMSALSVTFDEEFHMAFADLDAAEQFGWPVAAPEAYPCAMRINPGVAVRPPLAWELELLEGCLRAIPDFLAKKASLAEAMTVPVASGKLDLVLSWVSEEK